MRTTIIVGCVVLMSLLMVLAVWAWNDSEVSAPFDGGVVAVQAPATQPRREGGERGGPGGFMAGPERGRVMFASMDFRNRDGLGETLALIGEASLRPDFNLSDEQRTKIQAIREEVKAARAKWQQEHAEALKKLSEASRTLREGGQREGIRELFQQRQEIMATAPTTEEAVQKLKAVLSAEQVKAMEAVAVEKRAEAEESRQQFVGLAGEGRGGFGGERGGFGGERGGMGGERGGMGGGPGRGRGRGGAGEGRQ